MDLTFATRKLQKACQNEQSLRRGWGVDGPRVGRRLTELAAFDVLGDVPPHPPWRRHQLKGDRGGQFAVDINKRLRLVFEVAHESVPLLPDGGIDLSRVTAIRILEVTDYHG